MARCTVDRFQNLGGSRGISQDGTKGATAPDEAEEPPSGLLNCNFTANRPGSLWVSDVTRLGPLLAL